MINFNPQEIFDRALSSSCGIEIVPDDPKAAQSIRRKLYVARNKFRERGIHVYDNLSFLIRYHDIWIVRRDKLHRDDKIPFLDCRPLNHHEALESVKGRDKKSSRSYIL